MTSSATSGPKMPPSTAFGRILVARRFACPPTGWLLVIKLVNNTALKLFQPCFAHLWCNVGLFVVDCTIPVNRISMRVCRNTLQSPRCQTITIRRRPTNLYSANPVTISVHLQLLSAQRGKELGFVVGWKAAANNRKFTQDFTTPINLKCCSIWHRLAVIRLESFEISTFGRLVEGCVVGICTNWKPIHDVLMPLNTNICAVGDCLTVISLRHVCAPRGQRSGAS